MVCSACQWSGVEDDQTASTSFCSIRVSVVLVLVGVECRSSFAAKSRYLLADVADRDNLGVRLGEKRIENLVTAVAQSDKAQAHPVVCALETLGGETGSGGGESARFSQLRRITGQSQYRPGVYRASVPLASLRKSRQEWRVTSRLSDRKGGIAGALPAEEAVRIVHSGSIGDRAVEPAFFGGLIYRAVKAAEARVSKRALRDCPAGVREGTRVGGGCV